MKLNRFIVLGIVFVFLINFGSAGIVIRSPLTNAEVINNLSVMLNATNTQGFNSTINYSWTGGLRNYTLCTSCAPTNFTTITFPRQGYYNLTIWASNSTGSVQTNTSSNIFIGNRSSQATIKDTYTSADSPNKNFGNQGAAAWGTGFQFGEQSGCGADLYSSLFQFPVNTIAGVTVVNATAGLYVAEASIGTINSSLHEVLASWNEGTGNVQTNNATINGTTYNERWFGQSWGTAGLGCSDYNCTPILNYTSVYAWDVWWTFSLTNSVRKWVVDNSTNNGFYLKLLSNTGSCPERDFLSKESATNKPYLNITYYTSNIAALITNILTNSSNFTTSTVNFTYNISDDNDYITNISLFLDGIINTTISNQQITPNINTTLNISVLGISEGTHSWYIQAYDSDGAQSNSSTFTFSVDSTAPALSITTPSNNTNTTNTNLNINYTASDAGNHLSTCWYSNDTMSVNTTLASCSTNITTVTWAEGLHTVKLWANDTFGNVNSTQVSFRIDTTGPVITITNPVGGQSFTATPIDFNYTIIDNGVGTLGTCWYRNNTDGNKTIACGTNTTLTQSSDGTFTITIWANDSLGNIGTDSHTWSLNGNSPSVNLLNPGINKWFNSGNNIRFNFTATDTDGISTCELWGNWTGTWHKNQTLTSVVSGADTNFNLLNISNGIYRWNVWCNDSSGLNKNDFAVLNRTFNIDSTTPSLAVNSITTTPGSQTVLVNFSATGTNLDTSSCIYNITNSTGGIDGLNSNVTIPSCSSQFSVTVSTYDTYNIVIYESNLAGTRGSASQIFTTSAAVVQTQLGGGGSTPVVVVSSNNTAWSVKTDNNGFSFQVNMVPSSSVRKTLQFQNLGTSSRTIAMSCEDVTGDLCKYITFDKPTFNLPLVKNVLTANTFTITAPPSLVSGKYVVNIVATDDNKNRGIITTTVNFDLNFLTRVFAKLSLSRKITDTFNLPYLLILLFAILLSWMLLYYTAFKKVYLGAVVSPAIAVIIGLFIVLVV